MTDYVAAPPKGQLFLWPMVRDFFLKGGFFVLKALFVLVFIALVLFISASLIAWLLMLAVGALGFPELGFWNVFPAAVLITLLFGGGAKASN